MQTAQEGTGPNAQAVQDAFSRMQIDAPQPMPYGNLKPTLDKHKAVPLAFGDEHPQASSGCEWAPQRREHQLSDFRPIRKLYRGYASKVYLAEDMGKERQVGSGDQESIIPESGKRVVLKVYDLLRLSPLTKFQLDREIRLHSKVVHKHIIGLQAAFSQVWCHSTCLSLLRPLWLVCDDLCMGVHVVGIQMCSLPPWQHEGRSLLPVSHMI